MRKPWDRPALESLESRYVLSTFIVDLAADESDGIHDPGDLSLREAVELANASEGSDAIRFASALDGTTLTLTAGQLELTDDTVVRGLDEGGSAIDITLSGGGASRLFLVSAAAVEFQRLTLTDGSDDFGGLIQVNGGSCTIRDSTLAAGSSTLGGAVYANATSIAVITRSTIRQNSASEAGGAIYSTGVLTIGQTTLSDNTSGTRGGAIYASDGLTIRESTLTGNEAAQHGGAVYVDEEGSVLLVGNTFSDNHAGDSGGAVASTGETWIANSTVVANVADADSAGSGTGGGVASLLGVLTLTSTIVAGNTLGSGGASDLAAAGGTFEPDSANNLIGDAASSAGITDGSNGNIVGQAPQLGALGSHGGLTQTFAPLPGSPVIDAGSNPLGLVTDQRGATRVAGADVDIGAYEAQSPALGALELSVETVAQGEPLTLSATGATDEDGDVESVAFYLDANRDGVADDDELLGVDDDADGGFTFLMDEAATTALDLGDAEFLAVATDNDNFDSAPVQASVGVIYSLRALNQGAVHGASTADGEHQFVIRNAAGDLVVFTGAEDQWQAVRLANVTGAPAATAEPVIWTDPKDGQTYIAAPTASGFVLFTRAADGTWSYRDLADELGVTAEAPVGTLTQFASTEATGRVVILAGLNSSGELVAFRQTDAQGGQQEWNFVNLSDDLASQGMQTPAFTEVISYVTPWNAWTIAGIDDDGDVQGVWLVPASFDKWRVDNLSDITGAPPMSGQLTVTQTSWHAINLGGVNDEGHLVVTWWVPSFGGNWVTSDLTEVSGGETLRAGRATGFVTPWGAINYAGLNEAGEVVAYWWTPQTDQWLVNSLTGNQPDELPRPAGTLTSHVSAAGVMSIVGAAESRDVVRVWWAPDSDGLWHLADISGTAVRT